MKKVAILQSNYIPWKGYFDLIAAVDEFILYDDMQYTRRDWRNRNLIKTPQGLQWLTVPVKVSGKYLQSIRETEIDGHSWAEKHWKNFLYHYKRAPYFDEIAPIFEPIYRNCSHTRLSELNREFIETVCHYMGISTKISNSADYELCDGKTERLAEICLQTGGTEYISGPAAKEYIDPDVFLERNIKLTWFNYSGYPEYPQLWGAFEHGVTVLDMLFNCGQQSSNYMRHLHS